MLCMTFSMIVVWYHWQGLEWHTSASEHISKSSAAFPMPDMGLGRQVAIPDIWILTICGFGIGSNIGRNNNKLSLTLENDEHTLLRKSNMIKDYSMSIRCRRYLEILNFIEEVHPQAMHFPCAWHNLWSTARCIYFWYIHDGRGYVDRKLLDWTTLLY